jgi:DHA2 family methylenomycin A resistance protein-like MFS transporter
VWAAASSLALPAGPLLGGLLVDRWGWPSIFWVNVPVGVVAAVLLRRAPDTPRSPTTVDPVGQALLVLGLAAIVGGAIQAQWWLVAIGVPVLVARARALPRWTRSAGNLVALLMNGGGGPVILLVTLLLHHGRSSLATGLWLLPGTLPLALVAVPAGRLTARLGPRVPMAVGMALAAAGALALVPAGSPWSTVPGFTLVGVGLALNTAPMVVAVLGAAPHDQQAVAGAVNDAARQVGSAVGVAALGAAGFGTAMGVVAGLWAAAAVVAVTHVS